MNEREQARLRTWEGGAAKFINHGGATPHKAWISGFNDGFDAGLAHASEREKRLEAALRHYAEKDHWRQWSESSPIENWYDGSAGNGYDIAKAALDGKGEKA